MEFKKGDTTFSIEVLGLMAGTVIATTLISEIRNIFSVFKK